MPGDKGKRLRSVWGTTPILSIAANAESERLLGVESETVVFSTYFLTDRFTRNFGKRVGSKLLRGLAGLLYFPRALMKYNLFHYFCDRGILPTRRLNGICLAELVLLRLFGKKIFVYTYGADVRTREKTLRLGKYNCCNDCKNVGKACICSEGKQEKNLRNILTYATEVFSMGDMIEYTPGSNPNLFFWPINVNEIEYVGTRAENGKSLRIVHAPNHREYKGTKYLIEAVNGLKKQGYELELSLIEGVPNDFALKLYREADIVAEQFVIGWHGYLAIEAMAIGKPVICYVRKREYLLDPDACPIVNANPDTLMEVIRDLADNPRKRQELGYMGRRYVEKNYSLEAFAARLKKVYEKHGIF